MVYTITKEKDFDDQIEKLKLVNFREYTILHRKIDEIASHAKILENHNKMFNNFDKPLQDYKWVEIDDKILVFTIDAYKREIHLCEYLPKNEVFN
ncbi:MAG: hypothetical protein LUG89_02840 [Methanosphaera sp.]|nr:hypothetical protein [Methanosphaera sp.]